MHVIGRDEFSQNIAEYMGLPYAGFLKKTFSDGEVFVKAPDFADSDALVVLRMDADVNSYLAEMLLLTKALRDSGKSVDLFIPYLPYARQDKSVAGESSVDHVIGMLADSAGRIVTVTSHCDRDKALVRNRVHNIDGFVPVIEHLKKYVTPGTLVVAPDEGVAKLAKTVAGVLKTDYSVLQKKRDSNGVETSGSIGREHNSVVIIDDMISTGGTMLAAVSIAKKSVAGRIKCACVHAVPTNNSRLGEIEADADIIATNTIQSPFSVISLERYASEGLSKILKPKK